MPVDFLSPAQQENYGKYPNDLSPEFIANYFFLDDEDKEWIKSKRGQFSRLGYALQLTTVRYIGTFLDEFELLKLEIRLSTDMKLFSTKKQAALSALMDGIGKQVISWRNASR